MNSLKNMPRRVYALLIAILIVIGMASGWRFPSSPEDPLHSPVLKPTPAVTATPTVIPELTAGPTAIREIPTPRYRAVIPAGWDTNGDGVVDYKDVDAKAGELAGMTSYIRLHGGCVAVDTFYRTKEEACKAN